MSSWLVRPGLSKEEPAGERGEPQGLMPLLETLLQGFEDGQLGNVLPANPSTSPPLCPSPLPGAVGWEGVTQQPPRLAHAHVPADGAHSHRPGPAQPRQDGANNAGRRDHGAGITFHTSLETHFSPDPSRQIKRIVVLKTSYLRFVWALMILVIGDFQEDFAAQVCSLQRA